MVLIEIALVIKLGANDVLVRLVYYYSTAVKGKTEQIIVLVFDSFFFSFSFFSLTHCILVVFSILDVIGPGGIRNK